MNAECAVRSVGFFGPEGEGVYCCTNTETLSLWHAAGAQRIKDFGDLRALARGEAQEAGVPGDAGGSPGDGAGDASASAGLGIGQAAKAVGTGKEWGIAVDCTVGCQVKEQVASVLQYCRRVQRALGFCCLPWRVRAVSVHEH